MGSETHPEAYFVGYYRRLRRMQAKKEVSIYYEDFFKFVDERDKVVLDAGSGTGYITKILKKRGNTVTSIDPNPYATADINTKVENLPFKDGSFDSTYLLDVLEHIPDGRKALDELWRVTKMGGYLYMIVPNGEIEALFESADPTHIKLYTYSSIQYLLRRCGFKIIKMKASGLPLLNKINFRLARRLAFLLGKIALPFASPSFWIKAQKVEKQDTLIVSNPAGWGKPGVMGGAELRVVAMWEKDKPQNQVIAASSNFTDTFPAYLVSRLTDRYFVVYFQTDAYETTWWKTYKKMVSQNVAPRFKIFLMSICGMISLSLMKEADTVYCFSYTNRDFLLSLGYKNIEMLSVSVDVSETEPHPTKSDAIFVGRFEPIKGVDDLYKIWNEVVKEKPNAKLVMIGEKKDSTNNIIYPGHIPQKEVLPYLKSSKVFVFPSKSEGWSQAVVEAHACGLHVIGYDIPFMREFKLRYGGVTIVTLGDYKAFAEEVLKWLI